MAAPARTLVGISVFWLGLSLLGDGFAALVVPVRVAGLADPTVVATTIGLVTFVALGAGALIQPIAGAISDAFAPRVGRGGLLLAGALASCVSLAAFGAASNLGGILGAFVLLQIAAAFGQGALQGYIPDLIPAEQRGRAAGAKGMADYAGAFLGFLVLGALIASGDVRPALLVAGAFVVLTAIAAVALVREARRPRAGQPLELGRRVRAAFRVDLDRDGPFLAAVAARFVFLLGIYVVGRFFLLIVAERLGIDPAKAGDEAGGYLALLTLGTAIAALPGGMLADRLGRARTMAGGAALAALGALVLLLVGASVGILAGGLLLAVGSAGFAAANWARTVDLVPAGEAARYMGLANIGTAGAAAVAGLFGPVADLARAVLPGVGDLAVLVPAIALFGIALAMALRNVGEQVPDVVAHPVLTRAGS